MSHVKFLERLVDLDSLPSTWEHYDTMREQLEMNLDYFHNKSPQWMLDDSRLNLRRGDPDMFLRFLCLMAHPLAQSDAGRAKQLVEMFNEVLAFDDIEIVEDYRRFGGIVWKYQRRARVSPPALDAMAKLATNLNLNAVSEQLRRIDEALPGDPAQAIGQAKEMVESVCKEILDAREVAYGKSDDVADLVSKVRSELSLLPHQHAADKKGADAIKRTLGNLGQIVQSIAELRNDYGTGHGWANGRRGLQPRHARLVVGSAATLCAFLLDTHLYWHETDLANSD